MGPISCGSRTVGSVADVIVSDGNDMGEPTSTTSASDVRMDIGGDDNNPASQTSLVISEGDHAASGDTPCDEDRPDDWNIRDCVQIHERTKFLRSSIACVLLFLGEITILLMKGLQCNVHKKGLQCNVHKWRGQIVGTLLRL